MVLAQERDRKLGCKLTVSQRLLEGLHLEERVQDEFKFSNALVAGLVANMD
jgi:hypothetical protein